MVVILFVILILFDVCEYFMKCHRQRLGSRSKCLVFILYERNKLMKNISDLKGKQIHVSRINIKVENMNISRYCWHDVYLINEIHATDWNSFILRKYYEISTFHPSKTLISLGTRWKSTKLSKQITPEARLFNIRQMTTEWWLNLGIRPQLKH